MAGSKYYDTTAAVQVIGSIVADPTLLDQEGTYSFHERDFANDFHRVVFGAIYNLHESGIEKISPKTIETYLQDRPKSSAIYTANKGSEWIINVFREAEVTNFDRYYGILKKMTLLRTYNDFGLDVSWIYDADNITDMKKKEEQINNLEEMSLQELAETVENRFLRVREMVVDNDIDESCQIGDGIQDLIDSLSEKPINGYTLFDKFTNKITMGARPGCFYLRSGSTGLGRLLIF